MNKSMSFLLVVAVCLTVSADAAKITGFAGSLSNADQFRLDHGYACQTCVGVANTTSALAGSPHLQHQLETNLHKHVCAKLSKDQQQQCEEDIRVLLPALLPAVASMDSTQACLKANLCGPEAAGIELLAAAAGERRDATATPTMSNGMPCPMCKFLMTEVVGLLEQDSTEQEMLAQAHEACQQVDSADRDGCNSRVEFYGRIAFLLIRDISPAGVCHLAQSCPPDADFPGHFSIPEPLLASFAALARPDLMAQSNDGECDTCKEIVMQAAAMLANPEIQKQLLEDAKQACEIFKTLKDQCTSYVEIYGPLAITMALGYMQPQTLCTQLGYCKPPSLADQLLIKPATRAMVS